MTKIFLLIPLAISTLNAQPLHIHIISGSKEYKANESMVEYTKELIKVFKAKVTHTATTDKSKNLPNLNELKDADLLIIFCRRLDVQTNDLTIIHDYLKSKKSVIGIRSASHAFETFLGLDKQYFGGSYSGHDKEFKITMKKNETQNDHAILKGVSFTNWVRLGKPYYNYTNSKDTVLLLSGTANNKSHPMAWTRNIKSQRVFYTSMGLPQDFENKNFIQLLNNAVTWTTKEVELIKK